MAILFRAARLGSHKNVAVLARDKRCMGTRRQEAALIVLVRRPLWSSKLATHQQVFRLGDDRAGWSGWVSDSDSKGDQKGVVRLGPFWPPNTPYRGQTCPALAVEMFRISVFALIATQRKHLPHISTNYVSHISTIYVSHIPV